MIFSAEIQSIKVYRYINEFGSINRYEADYIGVCHLASRIIELKERGLEVGYIDENEVEDFHKKKHNGIRRYFIEWAKMEPKAIQLFTRLIDSKHDSDKVS